MLADVRHMWKWLRGELQGGFHLFKRLVMQDRMQTKWEIVKDRRRRRAQRKKEIEEDGNQRGGGKEGRVVDRMA